MESERPSTRSNTIIGNGGDQKRKHDVILRERARTESRNNCFRFRIARAWNDLPDSVKVAKTVNGFKNSYDTWMKKQKQSEVGMDRGTITSESNGRH